jgi:hypothetical protein
MRRETSHVMSHRPYAVDLSSLRTEQRANYVAGRIRAVWFRRPKGATVACVGNLWDLQDSMPQNAIEFLERHDDGRYGGSCAGRWDGERYWGAQEPDVMAAHLELLRPMLANCPDLPHGYDGWWRF